MSIGDTVVPCRLPLLTDVTTVIYRHVAEFGLKEPVREWTITQTVNSYWRGCGRNVFSNETIQKALLELQAMETLQFDWVTGTSWIRVLATPSQPTEELIHNTLLGPGLMGTYTWPTPYKMLDDVYALIPTPLRNSQGTIKFETISLDEINMCIPYGTKTFLKALRELRMMRALNFSRDGDTITIRDKQPARLRADNYQDTFGQKAYR